MQRNHQLAIAARQILCEALAVAPPCPDSLLGSLAVAPLPDGSFQALQDKLLERFAIEVPIVPFPASGNRLVRISAQIYNTPTQYKWLAQALLDLLDEESKLDMNK